MAPVEIPAAPASSPKRPHAVCIPYPAQGHINPMLKLAKLLHQSGFHITFVNSEYNHRRLLKSCGPNSLDGLPSFRFRNIPDGLPPTDADATQDIPSLCESTTKKCLPYFRELISELNCDGPPVTCIISDGVMSFTMDAAEELGVPEVLFWTTSACGFMGYVQFRRLIKEGYTPLKDVSYLTNGYCCTEWGIGMEIDADVRREAVERQVRELMAGEAGNAMREKAAEWRRAAESAAACGSGTSYSNLEEVVNNVLLPGRKN
ncbi:hypothetical protein MLD38_001677 [Melastoma candidum]|uniref:Uncharacterized protein n=1 Tax=Melastoma candidum TaxID=119954 RepID=A0ACB9SF02_9MYRT|nr:hypothetical protein MLD38_001677 [Melastoma candidum]